MSDKPIPSVEAIGGAHEAPGIYWSGIRAAAAWPITAYAQEKIARIGFLLIGDAEPMGPVFKALRDRGYGVNFDHMIIFKSQSKASLASLPTIADPDFSASHLSGFTNNKSTKPRCGCGAAIISLPAGAEAFKRDNPDAEMHLLDAGHFALESQGPEIASIIRDFLNRKLPK